NNALTINAQIAASALTRWGQNTVTLTADNPNLTGPITVNSGSLVAQNTLSGVGSAVAGVFNGQNIILGGAAATNGVQLRLGGTVFVNGDSTLDNNNNAFLQRINNLTFADLGPRSPIVFTNNGIYVAGTTTLGANNNVFNTVFNTISNSVLAGQVTGGTLTKF